MQSRLPAPATLPRQPAGFGHDSGLGAGDSIRVNVFGQPDLATETVVGDDGSVSLPLIDRVQVAGLSTQQASDRVAAAYESGGFLKQPQVNITIEELRSRQISVLGSVASPGRFPLESSTTVLDALALAGGITAQGSRTVALVRRGGDRHQRYSINLDQLLTAQNTGTIDLQAGDTIYVPVAPKFYIYGEVRRPDAYPLPESITVMQAISLGGGLTDRGSDSKVKLKRTLEDGRTVTRSVGLEDRVQPDDVIVVKERLF
ncbi:SLBB domain-containing protein [Abyssibacter sp.]|uniref:SLBB domain-containing protein n=1 Tax=Abyssibacter sp. TaxID=2320200 RepID=UPI000C3B350B|nr:SLBB domain-containing protein [Abyssibacter sp.]MBB86728.1 sugar transporter [Xanthomonadales bacterium]MCK5859823.1 SLBB domain-containing protein [Abyssibacter sp.]